MHSLLETPILRRALPDAVPPLENGDHLSASEFMRRYDAMPEVKKAELIQGRVYLMASPVRLDQHGVPDGFIQTWLGVYAAATPGVQHATNATTRLGPDDVPQPDGLLRLLAECGGQTKVDDKGYLVGAAELVVEVAGSSASVDTREKRDSYRRAGVLEYLVWRTWEGELDGWRMENDEYLPWIPDTDGILRSRVFPGLWLNVRALILEDAATVLATVQGGLASAEHAEFAARLKGTLKPKI
ncbi:MAG: Uma2 family endonuclease [Prosthecobacter sp.]|nr:Uma2 family endonuclease [Prosthecobacter sp.]